MKYFGTDGIRGRFGEFPVVPEVISRLIPALRAFMDNASLRIVIGRDSRESGTVIERYIMVGVSAFDRIFLCGVVPSPAIPMAILTENADFGIMITASHNPPADNGVKIFDRNGKISIEIEEKLEKYMEIYPSVAEKNESKPIDISQKMSKLFFESMASKVDGNKKIKKITVDTANGALAHFARKCYENVCDEVVMLGDNLTKKINDGVGSEYPEVISSAVLKNGSNLGIAHDGDGDRFVLCDENGNLVEGEKIFTLIASYLVKTGKLSNNKTIVTTIMSNRGLDVALRGFGVRVERTAVGDRNVASRMAEIGSNFGGECSGHMIFSDLESTSNGVLSAIMSLNALNFFGFKASDVQNLVKMYPQEKCSILVRKIVPLEAMPLVSNELKNISDHLKKFDGRLVIRYSGTEPKLRILVESESSDLTKKCLENVKNIIANSPVMY
ncbi:MAG: hypothetical protein LBH49_00980 [Puniceicoccales bacterium]|jgi:phosphoglucosamine mutase|nr:hypothetical protein [Puniceicoccales bacterium]